MLQPVLVSADLQLVAGFRRVEVLIERGVDRVLALVVDRPLLELVVRAAEEHAGQPVNLREVARALDLARRLGCSSEQAAARLLPALGLEPAEELVTLHLELLALAPRLLDFFVDKGFSLRRARWFCRLAPEQRTVVASLLDNPAIRGGRQLEEVATQLVELASREGRDLSELVQELGLGAPPDPAGPARLLARRMPETTRRRLELQRLAGQLRQRGIGLRHDDNFTREEVELVLSIAALEDLPRHIHQLQQDAIGPLLSSVLELAGVAAPQGSPAPPLEQG